MGVQEIFQQIMYTFIARVHSVDTFLSEEVDEVLGLVGVVSAGLRLYFKRTFSDTFIEPIGHQ